jgi:starch-binding outer membrane protein, SusD/RagB family
MKRRYSFWIANRNRNLKIHFASYILFVSVCILFTLPACKKLVEIKAPVTSINADNVYSTDATAISVLTGLYSSINNGQGSSFSGIQSISIFGGLSADELTLYDGMSRQNYISYFKNALVSNAIESYGTEHWTYIYNLLFKCNAAIEGVSNSTSLSPIVKQQLLGEAKFMRAFSYFYLVNLYGDVPLALTTDHVVNSTLSRTSANIVYQQIISDLVEAQGLLTEDYPDVSLTKSSAERVRPTKWSATALLSRVYLFNGEWAKAESEASKLIDNGTLFELNSNLENVFLNAGSGNKEAIWQLQPVREGWNTEDARVLIIPSSGPSDNTPVYLSSFLLASFEPADLRRSTWIDSVIIDTVTYFYPAKYKINTPNNPVTEYTMMLRLAEQFLIRAEARAQQDKITESQNDLNAIRARAGLANITVSEKDLLVDAVLAERQRELFTEYGHRWLDLKRTNRIETVMAGVATAKGGTWQSYQVLYPISYSDIQKNANLSQNPGY